MAQSPNPSSEEQKRLEEEPLSLVEESEGSTDHFAVEGSDEDRRAKRGEKAGPAGSQPRRGAEAKDSKGDDAFPEGTSTGGFDTMLGKIVVETGLVTQDEIELCNSLLRKSSDSSVGDEEESRTLADLLIENEFVTRRQIDRIRSEFEARKSSQRIPGYKIIRKLGAGAMATVFLARQLSLDRLVAIKVLPRKFSDNAKFIERFYKEGRAAAQLNHANIVGAYDVGQAGEHHYFVMEYVDGQTVFDHVAAHKRMDEKEAVNIVQQVAQALKHAHERGFIHRDIKPKNIMITTSGRVKLADLGLARGMTDMQAAKAEAGRAYGTPYYISPEQIRGELKIGPPADIYGLGATFYHMVTGRVPFEGKNPSAVMHKHLKSELKPPDHINPKLTAGCAQVIEKMMAKDVKSRYRNASDLLEDLELLAQGKPPHFAGRGFILPDVPAPSPAKNELAGPASEPLTSNPVFMTVLVVMIVSVLLNILVLALWLARA